MKKLNKPVVIIEGLLIVLMSTLAAYSLFGSNIRSLLLTVGLVLVGVLTIVWKNLGSEIFSGAVLLTMLPCLFKHDSIDILNMSNSGLPGVKTTFMEALGLGLVMILGYLLLKLLNSIQIVHKKLLDGEAEKDEVRKLTREQLVAVSIFVFFSGLISVPLILISSWLHIGILSFLSHFSGNIIAVGLGVLLLLAACFYWMARKVKS
jgi:hypothetical protein